SIIQLLADSGYPTPPQVWNSMIEKLEQHQPDTNEVHALMRLNHCFDGPVCKKDELPQLAKAYDAALSHQPVTSSLLAVHGEYAWHVINDRALTERNYRELVRRSPNEIEAQSNL